MRFSKGVVAVALLAVGCSTMPAVAPPAPQPEAAPPAVAEDTATGHYLLQGLGASAVTVLGVSASSTRNAYFPASHVTDHNSHTAWAPAWHDAAPTLCFDLAGATTLSGLTIKQSGAATTVDVAIWADGAWTTVATGLRSPSRMRPAPPRPMP